jgi:hypothetical protein
MLKRFFAFTAVVAVVFGVLAGCDNTGEQQRSVVVVTSVNEGLPVVVDVLEQGDSLYEPDGTTIKLNDDFIAQDWLTIQMQNNPYNAFVTTDPGMPHGDFIVTRYQVQWTRTDGGAVALPTYTGYTSQIIPSGEDAWFAILLVTFDNKNLPVLSDLCYVCPAAGDEIFMRADITFFGHEAGTERETEVEIAVGASFVDLVIETDEKNK